MKEEDIRELLRDMREDPIPADSLARVRLGVAVRVQANRRFFLQDWRVSTALTALVVVSVGLVVMRSKPAQPAPVQPPLPAVQALNDHPPVVETPAPVRPAAKPVRHIRKPPESPVEAGGATLIRIETPDPDVVILLLGSGGA
jgi:hypothetical protein